MPMTEDEKVAIFEELDSLAIEAVNECHSVRGASSLEAIKHAITKIEAIVARCEERAKLSPCDHRFGWNNSAQVYQCLRCGNVAKD